jgi:hypothetical protein
MQLSAALASQLLELANFADLCALTILAGVATLLSPL